MVKIPPWLPISLGFKAKISSIVYLSLCTGPPDTSDLTSSHSPYSPLLPCTSSLLIPQIHQAYSLGPSCLMSLLPSLLGNPSLGDFQGLIPCDIQSTISSRDFWKPHYMSAPHTHTLAHKHTFPIPLLFFVVSLFTT